MTDLANKKCIPCTHGAKALDEEELAPLLLELGSDWQINAVGHLEKSFKFKNFKEALDFANKAGAIAENEGHHPDLHLTWGKCVIEIWTHKVNGLTESDFVLAAKIDRIA